jgi:alpha-1,6-mannosyltransferase
VGVAGGAMVDRVPEGSGVGWLAPVDSVDGLASCLAAALSDPGLREAGRRARAMVEARFSWRRTFERVFGLYASLLGSPRAA